MYDQEASWDRLQGQHENQQTRRTTTALLKTAIIVFKMQLIFTVTEFRQFLKTLMRQDFLLLSAKFLLSFPNDPYKTEMPTSGDLKSDSLIFTIPPPFPEFQLTPFPQTNWPSRQWEWLRTLYVSIAWIVRDQNSRSSFRCQNYTVSD